MHLVQQVPSAAVGSQAPRKQVPSAAVGSHAHRHPGNKYHQLQERPQILQLPFPLSPLHTMNYPKKTGFNLHESQHCAFITYSVKTWFLKNLSVCPYSLSPPPVYLGVVLVDPLVLVQHDLVSSAPAQLRGEVHQMDVVVALDITSLNELSLFL